MAKHVVYHRNGNVEDLLTLQGAGPLDADTVTVSFPDGALITHHTEQPMGGVGFEFAEAGILLLRIQDSDDLLCAFAPTSWSAVRGSRYRAPRPPSVM